MKPEPPLEFCIMRGANGCKTLCVFEHGRWVPALQNLTQDELRKLHTLIGGHLK